MRKLLLIILLFLAINAKSQGTWVQKVDFIGDTRHSVAGFNIGTKGYLICGNVSTATSDYGKEFWEYNQVTDTWTQKADFPGDARHSASGFGIGTKGYLICGNVTTATSDYGKEFWEYNQVTDTWTQKTDFPGNTRHSATGFGIGTKGYLVCGNVSSASSDFGKEFWEYNQSTDTWTQKVDFPGDGRYGAAGFGIGTKGYLIGGNVSNASSVFGKEIWEYNQVTNTWTQKADFSGDARYYATGFAIGSKGYLVCGKVTTASSDYGKEFWEYTEGASTDVENLKSNNVFSIYPNPCKDDLTLSAPYELNDATMIIYDFNGIKILEVSKFNGKHIKINCNNLPIGIYCITLILNGNQIVNKNIIFTKSN
ncbi:MAG: T9SS type A sorting domain-containing protein [Chitinophagaceae bacterium]|nr:T9SS type A sorting domain-containing protein [Chitinophagaceae bacterium]